VVFRLYVRFRVVRLPGWDDLFVILYLVRIPDSPVDFRRTSTDIHRGEQLFTSVSSIAFLLGKSDSSCLSA
jgi:hypothetical protein